MKMWLVPGRIKEISIKRPCLGLQVQNKTQSPSRLKTSTQTAMSSASKQSRTLKRTGPHLKF